MVLRVDNNLRGDVVVCRHFEYVHRAGGEDVSFLTALDACLVDRDMFATTMFRCTDFGLLSSIISTNHFKTLRTRQALSELE
jgi:hypothetical protein